MRKNSVLVFSFVLVVIVAMAVGYKGWKKNKTTRGEWIKGVVDSFCVNDICVEKTAEGWLAKEGEMEVPAEDEMVEVTVSRMEDIVLDQIVSENKERFADLGMGQEKVVLEVNGQKLEMGSISQKYDGTYVKPEGEEVVYKVKMVLDKNSWSQVDYWHKKVLTNLPKLQVKKVIIEKGEKKQEIGEDEELTAAVSYIGLGQYLAGFEAGEEKYRFVVETEGESEEFLVGMKREEGENIYWASQAGKHFFEIDKELFDLLTGYID